MGKSKVAILRTSPARILEDLDRLHDLADARAALAGDAPAVLVPEQHWQYPLPAVNSPPWQLDGVARALRARGIADVRRLPGDTDPGMTGGVPAASASRAAYRPTGTMAIVDRAVTDLTLPDAIRGANIVLLPTAKTHAHATLSGALACAFGLLAPAARRDLQTWIHPAFVDALRLARAVGRGLFAVMDGTTAGDGPGPRTVRPVVKDVILASADPVALDAVAARMMGFDPMAIEHLRYADELGLGRAKADGIELVGEPALADERWGFTVGANLASRGGDVLWHGPLARFQRAFTHSPLAKLLDAASAAYHDRYRWPVKDRQVFDAWRADTAWGPLFDRYAAP